MSTDATRSAGGAPVESAPAGRASSAIRVRLGSISGKISLLIFSVIAALTAVLSGIYITHDLARLEAEMIRELSLLTDIVGHNAMVALAFEDSAAARRLLGALEAEPSVLRAEITRSGRGLFAAFEREILDGRSFEGGRFESEDGEAHARVAEVSGEMLRDGHRWHDDRLVVARPIRLEGRELGSIRIVSDLRQMETRKRGYLAIGGGIGLGAILLAFVLTAVLRRWISNPIEDLAALAQRVSAERRFDLRATRTSGDEVGDLVLAFNEMLAQIQLRDAELSVANQHAEEAAEQLAELLAHSCRTNQRLGDEIVDHERTERALRVKSLELERSNYELNQFAYAASHDLQEPLRMVTMFTQLLQRRYGDALDEDARGYIDFAVDGASRMRQLIQDLLEYSRTSRISRKLEPVDCNALVGSVVSSLRVAIDESEALVHVGKLPVVEGNTTRLFQLFQNLISNAIKFRGECPPEVFVDAEEQGEHWLFRVRDNGIGIHSDFAERIFLVFQRLHTREEYEGTGIGLAICQRIVGFHGGEIRVESVEGEGATFLFTLRERQVAPDEAAPVTVDPAEERSRMPRPGATS